MKRILSSRTPNKVLEKGRKVQNTEHETANATGDGVLWAGTGRDLNRRNPNILGRGEPAETGTGASGGSRQVDRREG